MDILELLRSRHTTKHYDPARKISEQDIAVLRETLRLTPSSVNAQPWHFFEASSESAKAKILPAILDFNQSRVADSSVIFIAAVKSTIDDSYLSHLLQTEINDGRFAKTSVIEGADASRRHFVSLHRDTLGDLVAWETHQAYIAMGFLLFAAGQMGIQSTPIEGMDFEKMDEILGLKAKGLQSVYCVALGYGSPTDGNATRPKSRLPMNDILSIL